MSSFLQRSKCDPVQIDVIAALGILLLFFVRLGSLGLVVFFVVFNNWAEITSCVELCVSTDLFMCLVLESYCSYRLDSFTMQLS